MLGCDPVGVKNYVFAGSIQVSKGGGLLSAPQSLIGENLYHATESCVCPLLDIKVICHLSRLRDCTQAANLVDSAVEPLFLPPMVAKQGIFAFEPPRRGETSGQR